MVKMNYLLATAVAVCLTIKNVKKEVCRAMCRRDGYQSGYWKNKKDQCSCTNSFDYKYMTREVLSLGNVDGVVVGDTKSRDVYIDYWGSKDD